MTKLVRVIGDKGLMNEDFTYRKSARNDDDGVKNLLLSIIVLAYLVTTYGMAVHARVPMLLSFAAKALVVSQGENSESKAQTRWLPKRHLPLTRHPAIFLETMSFLGHPSRDIDSPRRNVHDSDVGPHTVPDRSPGPNRAPPSA